MRRTISRAIVATVLLTAAGLAIPAPAFADGSNDDPPNVVDEPDTSNLHNKWTFAPLGVPVFGVIDSVSQAPGRLLPS